MRRLWRPLFSIKTAAVLMLLLVILLLLHVALPQERFVGPQGIEAVAAESAVKGFLLVDLGFRNMPTSPVFITVLVLFFVNLGAVLTHRATTILERIRPRTLSANQLDRRAKRDDALRLPRPEGWRGNEAASVLRRLGYKVSQPGDHGLFAEKNRTGLLGFLVFHLSFFPICAGGLMLYYTRSDALVMLTEGQAYDAANARVLRKAPIGGAPDLAFEVVSVDAELDDGEPVQLTVALDFIEDGRRVRRTSRVNHPASSGHTDLLVDRVGVAPVLRLLDAQGATVDIVTLRAPLSSGDVNLLPLAGGELEVELDAVPLDESFPGRQDLVRTPVSLHVYSFDQPLFSGKLRPGEIATVGSYAIKLEEIRYWTRLHVVAERGGWLLIAGFVLAVVGLVWRLLLVRREIGVVWYDDEVVLFGTTEFYRGRFRDDLEALGALLVEQPSTNEEVDA